MVKNGTKGIRIRVLIAVGTRPEAIKMAPLIRVLSENERFETEICVTGQHRQMLDQVLDIFEIRPDYDLDLMREGQSLPEITSNVLTKMGDVYEDSNPDLVLVHGDTSTTFAAALAAFYRKIPVGHVEAGLRTGNLLSPWPEEANRKLAGVLAELHFAPTQRARENLLTEGYAEDRIYVTGNTVIDALLMTREKLEKCLKVQKNCIQSTHFLREERRIVLITGHRRENFGKGFKRICTAIRQLAKRFPEVDFVYPVHLNPKVQVPVSHLLAGLENVALIRPLDYSSFVYLMNRSHIILTDSGGIQEEAPTFRKPVLVMRDTTERPEALEYGTARLVGTKVSAITEGVSLLLTSDLDYIRMSRSANPYGDGKACQRIVATLIRKFALNDCADQHIAIPEWKCLPRAV